MPDSIRRAAGAQRAAQAFVIGADFIGDDKVALVLGDNIFYGPSFGRQLRANTDPDGAIVYAYYVNDPERYGVVTFDENDKAVSIVEKPVNPPSNYAVPGLYFYDNDVVGIAANLEPSARGEYEITDVNKAYLEAGRLFVSKMDRGMAWLDTGTHHSLMQASQYVQVIEERQGLKIGCIEEIAWRMGYIDDATLEKVARPLQKSGYGDYLLEQLKRGRGSSKNDASQPHPTQGPGRCGHRSFLKQWPESAGDGLYAPVHYLMRLGANACVRCWRCRRRKPKVRR